MKKMTYVAIGWRRSENAFYRRQFSELSIASAYVADFDDGVVMAAGEIVVGRPGFFRDRSPGTGVVRPG